MAAHRTAGPDRRDAGHSDGRLLRVLIHQQGDQPLPWVLALLLAGALLAVYGAIRQLPHRRAALLAAGAALTTLGLLALPSIGLPIIASGFLALASILRSPQQRAP